jgi:hypothetical protein
MNEVINNSQIRGGTENAVPVHVEIPWTGSSYLPYEAVLQGYLQFPYKYFLLVLLFRGCCCKVCPSDNPRKKNHKD